MATPLQVKKMLLDSLRLTVSNKALAVISETKEPEYPELDEISFKYILHLFTPRAYEELKGDWEWYTGKDIPLTLRQALDHME